MNWRRTPCVSASTRLCGGSKLDPVRQRLGHLAPLGGAVPALLLELQVRADLAPEALEVVRLVGLEEVGVQLRQDPLAHLLDIERVVGGLARERRHRLEVRGKRDRRRSSCRPSRRPARCLPSPGMIPSFAPSTSSQVCGNLGVELLVAGDLRDRLSAQGPLVGQLDVVALLRRALHRLEVGRLGAERLDDAVDLGVGRLGGRDLRRQPDCSRAG